MSHKAKRKPFLAVVSSAMPADALVTLRCTAADVVLLPPDPLLPTPVASHPDMLLFAIGGALVVHRTYYAAARPEIDRILQYTGLRLVLTDCPWGNKYPLDIALNGLVCDNLLFGRTDALAPEILTLAEENGITPIPIRQGYAGCSGLVVDGAVITADPSLTEAARNRGIPVIPFPDRDILLPGYDHGFIGGCGGVWKNIVYLCGTVNRTQYEALCLHPFLQKKAICFLSPSPLYDCGGIKIFPI